MSDMNNRFCGLASAKSFAAIGSLFECPIDGKYATNSTSGGPHVKGIELKQAKSQPTQIQRFKEAARALECDDDPAAFEKKLAKIARAKAKGDGEKNPARG
jgi:hypothetical protein